MDPDSCENAGDDVINNALASDAEAIRPIVVRVIDLFI